MTDKGVPRPRKPGQRSGGSSHIQSQQSSRARGGNSRKGGGGTGEKPPGGICLVWMVGFIATMFGAGYLMADWLL